MLLEAVLVLLPAIPANLIVWLYWRARWWETPLGKGMAVTAVAVALLLDLAVIARAAPDLRDLVHLLVTPLYFLLTYGLTKKYLAFRALERDRLERIARVVSAMPETDQRSTS